MPESDTLNAAMSLIPFFNGDTWSHKKAEYLAFRFTGFPSEEARRLTETDARTVNRWRADDPRFREMEKASTGVDRKAMRREILQTLFIRNLTLTLQYDFRLLRRILGLDVEEITLANGEKGEKAKTLTAVEMAYLMRARSNYTPQALQALETTMLESGNKRVAVHEWIERVTRYEEESNVSVGKDDGNRPPEIILKAARDAEGALRSEEEYSEGAGDTSGDSTGGAQAEEEMTPL